MQASEKIASHAAGHGSPVLHPREWRLEDLTAAAWLALPAEYRGANLKSPVQAVLVPDEWQMLLCKLL
jgi:hypothetical protein